MVRLTLLIFDLSENVGKLIKGLDMSDTFNTQHLPYTMPTSAQAQATYLATILKIPGDMVANADQEVVQALCATIIYRHLDRMQRMEAMELVQGLKNRRLISKLISLILDTTFVNPQWGLWSLTNEELLADQAFHSEFDTIASAIGLSASGLGAKDLIKTAWKSRKMSRGGLATVIIWGTVFMNKSELNKANEELARRYQLNTSKYF